MQTATHINIVRFVITTSTHWGASRITTDACMLYAVIDRHQSRAEHFVRTIYCGFRQDERVCSTHGNRYATDFSIIEFENGKSENVKHSVFNYLPEVGDFLKVNRNAESQIESIEPSILDVYVGAVWSGFGAYFLAMEWSERKRIFLSAMKFFKSAIV